MAGRPRLEIADEEVVLGEGNAVHFDADRSHRFKTPDGRDAEAIVAACAVPLAEKLPVSRGPLLPIAGRPGCGAPVHPGCGLRELGAW